jgi:hypothetical protein
MVWLMLLIYNQGSKSDLCGKKGPGKITYMFSAKRMQISAPRQASVGRASRRGSRKQKSAYVRQKMYMLIYTYTGKHDLSQWQGFVSLQKPVVEQMQDFKNLYSLSSMHMSFVEMFLHYDCTKCFHECHHVL